MVDPHAASAVSNSLLLTLAAGLLVEGLVVLARALRTDSHVIWSKGKEGQPHQMSPFLDGLRDTMNGRSASDGADPSWSNDSFPSLAGGLRDARRSRHAARRARRDLRR